MADKTEIAWCDSTLNPWIGCTKVGPGCDNCYAEKQDNHRKWTPEGWGAGKPRKKTSPENWRKPVRWNAETFLECACGWRGAETELLPPSGAHHFLRKDKRCPGCGEYEGRKPARRRVFCASLADVFDNEAPQEWRDELFALMEATPNLDWLVLTKRIGNVGKMIPCRWFETWPANVRIGITVVTQKEANRDIPQLLRLNCPNFLSMEPLLEGVDLTRIEVKLASGPTAYINALAGGVMIPGAGRVLFARHKIQWVIVGGESGPEARPMHPEWARVIRDHCEDFGTPYLFKQWGEFQPVAHCEEGCQRVPEAVHISGAVEIIPSEAFAHLAGKAPGWTGMCQIGKKKAGRTLDGKTHNGYPGAA